MIDLPIPIPILILIVLVIVIGRLCRVSNSHLATVLPMKTSFDHEKLDVYQESIRFVSWVDELLEKVPKSLAVHNQLDRASTSIPLNIAEGNGKYTSADRCRFFDIARGSALECAACLDVLVAKKRIETSESGKTMLVRIVSMLVGLIRSTSPSRVHEDSVDYSTNRSESVD
jgi:four helix bundle protein